MAVVDLVVYTLETREGAVCVCACIQCTYVASVSISVGRCAAVECENYM